MRNMGWIDGLISHVMNRMPGGISAMAINRENHMVVAGRTHDLTSSLQEIGQKYARFWEQVQRDATSSFGPDAKLNNLVVFSNQLNASVFPNNVRYLVCLESASSKGAAEMLCVSQRHGSIRGGGKDEQKIG